MAARVRVEGGKGETEIWPWVCPELLLLAFCAFNVCAGVRERGESEGKGEGCESRVRLRVRSCLGFLLSFCYWHFVHLIFARGLSEGLGKR